MSSAGSSRPNAANAARQSSRTISQMLVDGVIADEGMHLEVCPAPAPARLAGLYLQFDLVDNNRCDYGLVALISVRCAIGDVEDLLSCRRGLALPVASCPS